MDTTTDHFTPLALRVRGNKLLLLLRPDPARLPPLPGTQPLAIQTSQCLLLSVYYTALFSLQAVSTTHAQLSGFFFSATLFQVSIR